MIMNDIISKIKESNIIGITFHTSPDGDSIGSALSLYQALKNIGKKVYILSKEDIPETFKFLSYSSEVSMLNCEIKPKTDCIIVLDCGDVKRINANLDLRRKNYTLINVDHHLSNEMYGDLNFVDTKSAAVGEIVYDMIKLLNVKMDKNIAECIYTSLLTDTGGFRHSSTTSKTHAIAGELVDIGINFSEIFRTIFENKSFVRVKLYGKVIDTMEVSNGICSMKVTKEMLKSLQLEKNSDTSDVISLGSQIKDAEVTILLKEADEGIKISLRSKSKVDVRKIAEKFSGGGHVRAAGLIIKGKNINEAKDIIINEVVKEMM